MFLKLTNLTLWGYGLQSPPNSISGVSVIKINPTEGIIFVEISLKNLLLIHNLKNCLKEHRCALTHGNKYGRKYDVLAILYSLWHFLLLILQRNGVKRREAKSMIYIRGITLTT